MPQRPLAAHATHVRTTYHGGGHIIPYTTTVAASSTTINNQNEPTMDPKPRIIPLCFYTPYFVLIILLLKFIIYQGIILIIVCSPVTIYHCFVLLSVKIIRDESTLQGRSQKSVLSLLDASWAQNVSGNKMLWWQQQAASHAVDRPADKQQIWSFLPPCCSIDLIVRTVTPRSKSPLDTYPLISCTPSSPAREDILIF